jgi:hypothetical protein
MKRFLFSMAAGFIALAGLGIFATSASAHPAPCAPVRTYCAPVRTYCAPVRTYCAPVRTYCAPVYRGSHCGHRVYRHHVWFKCRKPC